MQIRRPSNYDISTAIMLGPVSPDPTLDTSQLDICRTVVDDSPSKLFVVSARQRRIGHGKCRLFTYLLGPCLGGENKCMME